MSRTIALGCAAALAWGCGRPDDGAGNGNGSERRALRPAPAAPAAPAPPLAPVDQLRAQLHPTTGAPVSGLITFAQSGTAIEISAHINGLAPFARHGLHVYTGTSCGRTGEAIGGHFDPAGRQHAGPDAAAQHAGDLGNIEANEEGHATLERRWDRVSLRTGPTALLGHVVAISVRPDDLRTQPDGKSGKPLACGVIE